MRGVLLSVICWCTLLHPVAGPATHGVQPRRHIKLTFLGNAGWQIEDGQTTILVDPYLTEFKNGGADNQNTEDDPLVAPDTASIDAHIHQANYILVTHGHYDHMIDAPYISKKTGATIICHESAAHIARAYGVSDKNLIVVRGGEDFQFEGFSVRVIPSLHSPLLNKHYNDGPWAGSTRPGLKAPCTTRILPKAEP